MPNGVAHIGPISTNGDACPAGSRNLAEYSSFTIDNNGLPNTIFAHDVNTNNGAARVDFTMQTAGPSLFGSSLGRTTGAGYILGNSGKHDSFHFRVDSTTTGPSGELKYLDTANSFIVQSNTITSFLINGNYASFSGRKP